MAPTCFGLRPSSGSLQLILAKVILILKHSVKLRRYMLCGSMSNFNVNFNQNSNKCAFVGE